VRIVFLGTPEFSVASLDAIIKAGFTIVGVVTAPDKPAGRGMKLTASAVKQYAVEHSIPVLQPTKLKDASFIENLRALKADLQVVIAFRMLPEQVWNMPPLGTVNLHASLLPDYRGAAPINWAIMNGETETGVSTFLLKHQIDTGDILTSEKVAISPTMNAGELHDILKEVGAQVIAPKIFTRDCVIDWNQPSESIHNKIRGLSPYPGAIGYLHQKLIKIYASSYSIEASDLAIGTINSDNKHFLRFRCGDGFINIIEIQMEGKKRMFIEDFLKGNKVHFDIL
jgi:methionyl-tRNA formyltransferase